MTTRLKLYGWHVIGAVAMSGTLLAVAPPLAPMVVGFWVIYLGMLAPLYLVGWLLNVQAWGRAYRVGLMVLGCVTVWLSMSALDLNAGVLALLLSVISLWPRRLA